MDYCTAGLGNYSPILLPDPKHWSINAPHRLFGFKLHRFECRHNSQQVWLYGCDTQGSWVGNCPTVRHLIARHNNRLRDNGLWGWTNGSSRNLRISSKEEYKSTTLTKWRLAAGLCLREECRHGGSRACKYGETETTHDDGSEKKPRGNEGNFPLIIII